MRIGQVPKLFPSTAMTGFFHLLVQPSRAFAGESPHDVAFILLDREVNCVPLGAEHRSLLLHLLDPVGVQFSDVHVDAHLGQRGHALGGGAGFQRRASAHATSPRTTRTVGQKCLTQNFRRRACRRRAKHQRFPDESESGWSRRSARLHEQCRCLPSPSGDSCKTAAGAS